eukprot:6110720-Amphidinium_carterae.1
MPSSLSAIQSSKKGQRVLNKSQRQFGKVLMVLSFNLSLLYIVYHRGNGQNLWALLDTESWGGMLHLEDKVEDDDILARVRALAEATKMLAQEMIKSSNFLCM